MKDHETRLHGEEGLVAITIPKRKDKVEVNKTMNNCKVFYSDRSRTAQGVAVGIINQSRGLT